MSMLLNTGTGPTNRRTTNRDESGSAIRPCLTLRTGSTVPPRYFPPGFLPKSIGIRVDRGDFLRRMARLRSVRSFLLRKVLPAPGQPSDILGRLIQP